MPDFPKSYTNELLEQIVAALASGGGGGIDISQLVQCCEEQKAILMSINDLKQNERPTGRNILTITNNLLDTAEDEDLCSVDVFDRVWSGILTNYTDALLISAEVVKASIISEGVLISNRYTWKVIFNTNITL